MMYVTERLTTENAEGPEVWLEYESIRPSATFICVISLKVYTLKYKTLMEFSVVCLSLFYKYFAPMEQVLLQNHD